MSLKQIFIVLFVVFSFGFLSDKPAYQLFDEKGKKTSYKKMLKEVEGADIILFGELHNNPINHWLQYELTKDVFEQINESMVLGAEMFEADNQNTLNEYLSGKFDYKTLKTEIKVWPNNTTDYQPLVDYALKHQLTFVATNIPRRYANLVYKLGFGALNSINDEGRKFIAPLPIAYDKELPGYKKIVEMSGGHGGENLPKAQAIKDATMAHFILKNWRKGQIFIHYNGTYHSNNFEGISWYLNNEKAGLKIVTIGAVEQDKIDSLAEENIGIANFTICTPTTMTKTH
ncbi:MAG: iron-regulated protein [Flavobacteriales bacterium CG18_big_fil_WC_8_21_14_2_50_32_9]|nr:ChaN family lipoprotein [Flavobacteriales bacterium]PIQ14390.1 MAG: iron-regulated protein [Flavobacteriales bacterium CG18_big_fil_WC_8_21_14_2_50_32_9]PJC62546.1 MAG: iron-regulated protein [Flavobacteriales bacterium CG_4_9_14_0_2_um_filter_32_27]